MPKCDAKTRYIPATFAWTLLLGTTTLFFYFPCQYYIFRHPWVPACQGVITFFVLANFTLATFMDPGVIPKAPPDEDREDDFRAPLYKNVEINGITVRMKWCATCKFYRPPRCSHCSVCNHCIETFDHHCPWVNNCIGRRNYRFFFFFLISLSIHMLSIFSLSLIFVLNSKERLSNVEPIVAMVIMGIVALLAIPIFGLTGFHMVLVSRGRTTNEQVTGKFKGGYNPFSRGCWNNCCYTQFGPQYPSLQRLSRASLKRVGMAGGIPSAISTISPNSGSQQVKVYTADNNGSAHRPTSSAQHAQYNKLSPGREGSDTDMEPQGTQSADCEPTPPLLQRRGSKNNFFMPPGAVELGHPHHNQRHSPYTRARPMDPSGRYGVEEQQAQLQLQQQQQQMQQQALQAQLQQQMQQQQARQQQIAMQQGGLQQGSLQHGGMQPQRPSPTMQQRIKALGVPTPLAINSPVRRSNPGTPTQPRRPDFIGVNAGGGPGTGGPGMMGSMMMGGGGYCTERPVPQHASPQRRFLSEGELARAGAAGAQRHTSDNIRELAGSPQRGVYLWKDTSPGQPPPREFYRSPLSPGARPPPPPPYHPALRGGVAVLPTQPSPHAPRRTQHHPRPMSFVRALEVSDSLEQGAPAPPQPAERASVYDMNYEISV